MTIIRQNYCHTVKGKLVVGKHLLLFSFALCLLWQTSTLTAPAVGVGVKCGLSHYRNDLNGLREQRAEENTVLYVTENDRRMRENYLTKSSIISR